MRIDSNKFIELLGPIYNDAARYCRALCSKRSPDDAEDILQQSILQALEKFYSLNDESKFRSWFFTIITRVFYTSVKRNFWKRFLPLDGNERVKEIPEIFNRMELLEVKTNLNNALMRLSTKERAAILLFEVANFSVEEVRAIQNERSVSAIKSRLSRARQKLRKYILNSDIKPIKSSNSQIKEFEDIENETIKLAAEYKAGK